MTLEQIGLWFLLAAACGVVFAPHLLQAIIGASVFSMLLALTYLRLHAPDIAITEATLGTGLSTLVFLVAMKHTAHKKGIGHDSPG